MVSHLFFLGEGGDGRLKTWPNNSAQCKAISTLVGEHRPVLRWAHTASSPAVFWPHVTLWGPEVTLTSCSDHPPAARRPSPHAVCQKWENSLLWAPCYAVSASHHLLAGAKKILNIYSFLKHKCIQLKLYQCRAYWIQLLSRENTWGCSKPTPCLSVKIWWLSVSNRC